MKAKKSTLHSREISQGGGNVSSDQESQMSPKFIYSDVFSNDLERNLYNTQ
jgi:hypothetical protein